MLRERDRTAFVDEPNSNASPLSGFSPRVRSQNALMQQYA
jgi:hypothetical protein